MTSRTLELIFLAIMAIAILLGGQFLLLAIAKFHGLAISVLGVLAIFVIYAFRRNFLAGGPQVRLNAARDGAFLAAIASTISFVVVEAKWSLGAAIVSVEVAIVVEMLARFTDVDPQRN